MPGLSTAKELAQINRRDGPMQPPEVDVALPYLVVTGQHQVRQRACAQAAWGFRHSLPSRRMRPCANPP